MERTLWLGAMVSLVMWAVTPRLPATTTAAVTTLPVLASAPDRPSAYSLREAVDVITRGNLFHPERAPVEVVQAPALVLPMGAPPSAKPQLVLRGVLGGPPWDALIEGVPGREGAVVLRAGETSAGLTLRRIGRDTVVVTGYDTTWKLTVRRPW
jgi:hypothetical protein